MKKISILILVFLINTNIYSQNFSLKSGLSISNVSTEATIPDSDPRMGVMFGAVTQYGEDNIRYSGELLFNQRGDKENIHFNYLDLAIKGSFFFNDEISLNIGPSFSYLLDGEYNESITSEESWVKFNDDDYENSINRLNYNACFGLSYKINDLLSIEYSYNIMLASITKEIDDGPSDELTSSSSIISISYCFNY
ncbi:MAG: outer membrane beta-barrel protein [Flavobacteriales bacterium]|jgi:hypothetical protein|nr:outer membrane beta-barrel protein [Flavobacteriales bacterium]